MSVLPRLGAATGLLALVLTVSCEADPPQDGGDTHWLGICTSDADCDTGSCLCGMCTVPCEGDGTCRKGPPAACFAIASPGVAERCGDAPPATATGICIAVCDRTTDCPTEMSCVAGACAPSTPTGPASSSDAGSSSPAPSAVLTARPSASDFADASPTVDLPGALALPSPAMTIRGDASEFEGEWVMTNYDGTVCQVDASWMGLGGKCPHVQIRQDADGSWSGVYWVEANHYPTLSGPLPAPTDPSVGYPRELDPTQYDQLFRPMPGVRYRLLDGVVDGTILRFWISPLQVIDPWCQMQTPYPWTIDGAQAYRCVPEGASAPSTDPGRLALCTPDPAHETFCANNGSDLVPSVPPPCDVAPCTCSAAGCMANWGAIRHRTSIYLGLNGSGFTRAGSPL